MRISEYINNCTVKDLQKIDKLLKDNSSSEILVQDVISVTLWGSRVVKIIGFEDTISVDDLANKVFDIGRKRCDEDNLSMEERVASLNITKKLRNYYRITDAKLEKKNWFTKLLNFIREFVIFPYTIRFHTEELGSMKSYFQGFSEGKFMQEFGGVKNSFGEYVNSSGSFGPPSRIMARESAIRGKIEQARVDNRSHF